MMKQNQMLSKIYRVEDILTTLKLFGINDESLNNMLDELPIYLWVHDENYAIVYGNRDFKEKFKDFLNQPCYQYLKGEESVCVCCPSKKIFENGKLQQCKLCRRGNSGSCYDINLFHTLITNEYGGRYILKSSLYVNDLGLFAESYFPETLVRYRERKKVIVMCASCKRVRDQDGNWIAIDNHIIDCFKARISHDICIECARDLYPTLDIPGLK